MQRPSSHTTVALVGIGTVGGGAAYAGSDAEFPGVDPGLAIVCLTAAAVAVVRRYALAQEQRMRALFTGLARQHHQRARELNAREQDLAQREESFRRTADTTQLWVNSVYARLDRSEADCEAERERRMQVETEYQQLCDEYNEVVREAAEAQAPPEAHLQPIAVGDAGLVHGPRHLYQQSRGPRPYLTVVDGSTDRQGSA